MPLFMVVGRNNLGTKVCVGRVFFYSEWQAKEKEMTPQRGREGGAPPLTGSPQERRVSPCKRVGGVGMALTRDGTRWCHAPS